MGRKFTDFSSKLLCKTVYVASVTHNEKPYKIRSMFYPKGEYIGFDPDSAPDKNGFYLEMGVYDTEE